MLKKFIGILMAGTLFTTAVTGFAAFEELNKVTFGTESDIEMLTFSEIPSKATVDGVEVDVEKYTHLIDDGALKMTTDILLDKSSLSDNYLKKGYNGAQTVYNFDAVSGKVNCSYKFKVDEGMERVQYLAAMAPIQIRLFGHAIQVKTGDSQKINTDFVTVKSDCVYPNKFYSMDILVDFDNSNVSVFFDGEKIIDRHSFYKPATAATGITLGGVSKVSFKEDAETGEFTNTTASIWYDDIVISEVNNLDGITKLNLKEEDVAYTLNSADAYTATGKVENNGVTLTTVTSTASPAQSTAGIVLPQLGGNVTVEFTLSYNGGSRAQEVVMLYDSSDRLILRWRQFGANLEKRNTDKSYTSIGTFEKGVANVKLELNMTDKTYNAYVNGVLMDAGANVSFWNPDAKNAGKLVLGSATRTGSTTSADNPITAVTSISDIMLYSGDGKTSFTNNFADMKGEVRDGELSLEYKSYNFGETPIEKIIIGAVYDENNNLIDCGIIDANAAASSAAYGKLSYKYNENMNGYKHRYFIWNNFNDMSSVELIEETTVGELLN